MTQLHRTRSLAAAFALIAGFAVADIVFTNAPTGAAGSTRASETAQTCQADAVEGLAATQLLNRRLRLDADLKAALRRSEQHMQMRGFSPGGPPVVVAGSQGSRVGGLVRVARAATEEIDSHYYNDGTDEIIIQAWTDGDPATWEGTITHNRLTDGSYAVFDMQHDTTSDEPPIYWVSAEGRDSEGRIRAREGGDPTSMGASTWQRLHQLIVAPTEAFGWRIRDAAAAFLTCAVTTCSGAYGGCRWSGAAMHKCMAGWCGGVTAFGCTSGTLLLWAQS